MNEQSPFLVPPYSALADIYDRAGMADYSRENIARYITVAQQLDWAGRRVLDLGCGTGVSTWSLARMGFRVMGVDNNPHMLARAQARTQSQVEIDRAEGAIYDPPSFVEMDIRHLESPGGLSDMVIASGGVLNAIQSLRELEQTISRVHSALDSGKLFVFDVRTIRGLAQEVGDGDAVYYDNGYNLTVVVRNRFSFETLSNTRRYIIFQQQGMIWERRDEIHVERGYPTQGIVAILERNGFEVRAVLAPDMTPFDIQDDLHGRAIFVAQKTD